MQFDPQVEAFEKMHHGDKYISIFTAAILRCTNGIYFFKKIQEAFS